MANRVYKVYGGGFGTGFAKGGGVNVTMHDEITPFLTLLQKHTKSHMVRAARHVAFKLKNILQDGIRRGSVDGRIIPARKGMNAAFRARVQRKIRKSEMPGKEKAKAMKSFLSTSTRRLKTLAGAIKYQKLPDNSGVLFGFASKAGVYYASMVQKGNRGELYGKMYHNRQPITDRQRRFFFSLGIMTKKKFTEQPRANVFAPFILGRRRYIEQTFFNRLDHLVEKDAEKARANAVTTAA